MRDYILGNCVLYFQLLIVYSLTIASNIMNFSFAGNASVTQKLWQKGFHYQPVLLIFLDNWETCLVILVSIRHLLQWAGNKGKAVFPSNPFKVLLFAFGCFLSTLGVLNKTMKTNKTYKNYLFVWQNYCLWNIFVFIHENWFCFLKSPDCMRWVK